MILNIRDQGWKFKSNKEDFSKNGEKNYLSSIFSNLFSLEISSESWSEWVDLSSLKDHCKKKKKRKNPPNLIWFLSKIRSWSTFDSRMVGSIASFFCASRRPTTSKIYLSNPLHDWNGVSQWPITFDWHLCPTWGCDKYL